MQETAEARILLVSTDLERVRVPQGRLSGAGYAVRVCGADAAGAAQLDQFERVRTGWGVPHVEAEAHGVRC